MKLRVREIKGKPSTPWMVAVPKILTQTKRVRKFFRSRGDALDYISRVYSLGYVKADWRENSAENGKLALAQCVSQFLMVRYEPGTTGNRTLVQERQILNNLTARYGNAPIDSLTHREIETWLRGINKAPQTRANYYRIAKRFFKWAHEKEEFIHRNPMIKVDEPRVPREEPEVLTAEQMQICLESAMDLDVALLAFLCLGGFAGVRTAEIVRMNWEDINWVDGHIGVLKPKQVTRWRPRNVTMLPVFRRHLEPFALKEGPIFPRGEPQLFELRNQLVKALGLKDWPDNCLRHSFATYHVPIHNDYPKLSIQMGHANPNMTRYKYGTLRARSVANQWWAL
jgi:integrase/recombinase XerD